MRGSLGQLLVQQGVIDASALGDALTRQAGRHPLASELYMLGHASERDLAMALSIQTGWPAIVLDESVIRLEILENVTLEWARLFSALVVSEDATTIVLAAARPDDAIVPARELGVQRGKNVELRIALDITLARTIRVAFARYKRGEAFLIGPEARRTGGFLAVVAPDEDEHGEHRQAQRAIAEAASFVDLATNPGALAGEWSGSTITNAEAFSDENTVVLAAAIDRAESDDAIGSMRALVVDPDPDGRTQVVAELERLGFECQAVDRGDRAIERMAQGVFDLVFVDVATPEVDGLRLCRAVKHSRRFARAKVVVTSSVVDSGQVADATLVAHGADGYLEKPLDLRRLQRLVRDLSRAPRDSQPVLGEAIGRYQDGDLEGAIARLRSALVEEPADGKLHFMLANMLQRAQRWAEAIDEYEAVVDLQPQYFPALTRLAYLYFRQGLHARAVETWRRALPVCEDPALRRNIELFMRKLVADMNRAAI